jgi:hypothetical protein
MKKSELATGVISQARTRRRWQAQCFRTARRVPVLESRTLIDMRIRSPNNLPVTKPETVRRVKTYSASCGYVYQYQFQDVHPSQQSGEPGNEYIYYVSADRKTMFPVRISVRRAAVDAWSKDNARALTGTEEYALAKMRLFQALDDVDDFATKRPDLTVDETNIADLLARLDL